MIRTYLFGAFGKGSIDVRDLCPERPAAQVRVTREASDYIVSVATLGVVLPHRVVVRCDERRR